MLTDNLSRKVDDLTIPVVDEMVTRPYRSTFDDFDQAANTLVTSLSGETLEDLYQGYLKDHRFMLGGPVDFERWQKDLPRYVSAGIRLDYIKRTRR